MPQSSIMTETASAGLSCLQAGCMKSRKVRLLDQRCEFARARCTVGGDNTGMDRQLHHTLERLGQVDRHRMRGVIVVEFPDRHALAEDGLPSLLHAAKYAVE